MQNIYRKRRCTRSTPLRAAVCNIFKVRKIKTLNMYLFKFAIELFWEYGLNVVVQRAEIIDEMLNQETAKH